MEYRRSRTNNKMVAIPKVTKAGRQHGGRCTTNFLKRIAGFNEPFFNQRQVTHSFTVLSENKNTIEFTEPDQKAPAR